jgi:hypothetical protein
LGIRAVVDKGHPGRSGVMEEVLNNKVQMVRGRRIASRISARPLVQLDQLVFACAVFGIRDIALGLKAFSSFSSSKRPQR